MAHLRSKDAKQSFDFFDKLQVGSLTKHEVKCAFISLFGKPPPRFFLHTFIAFQNLSHFVFVLMMKN
jgi:hypothetical protein